MKKTVYSLVHMEVIYVQRYEINYDNKEDLENKIYNIESKGDDRFLRDTFEYTNQKIAGKLDCDVSEVFEDDIEDEKKLTENILNWAENGFC